jgi:hypothetical protein
VLALSGLSIAEYFRDGAGTDQGKMYYSLWIISSVLHKQVLSFRHFGSYAICSRITNISYRNGSDAKRITSTNKVLLHLYKRFTFLQMI